MKDTEGRVLHNQFKRPTVVVSSSFGCLAKLECNIEEYLFKIFATQSLSNKKSDSYSRECHTDTEN